jgi:hypothetical protein
VITGKNKGGGNNIPAVKYQHSNGLFRDNFIKILLTDKGLSFYNTQLNRVLCLSFQERYTSNKGFNPSLETTCY